MVLSQGCKEFVFSMTMPALMLLGRQRNCLMTFVEMDFEHYSLTALT